MTAKTQTPGWYIHIVEHAVDACIKTLGPYTSERLAERADMGLNRQLDHEHFYTRIVEKE